MDTNLKSIDVDGAVREAQAEVEGITRSSFLTKGGAAVLSSGAIMAMLPEMAAAAKPSKKNDVAILNYALVLERLERAFYLEAVATGGLSGAVLELAKLIAAHESTHVDTLLKTLKSLKGKVPAAPTFDFKGTTADQTMFLQTAFVLENTGVHAYLGQAANLQSKDLLKAAASIVTVEARHAAAIAGYIDDRPYDLSGAGKNFTPQGAFDTPWSKKRVLKNVGATGFIVS